MSAIRPIPSMSSSLGRNVFPSRLAMLLGRPDCEDVETELTKTLPLSLDLSLLDNLTKAGLTERELTLILPPRIRANRHAKGQPLSAEESERAFRIARLLALAESVFGNSAKALLWLRTPLPRFAQRTAMEMMSSEIGGRMVEEMLIQIDEGYAA